MGLALGVGLKLRSQLLGSASGAAMLLATLGDTYGLSIDFTDQSMVIADNGTPANNYTSSGTVTSGALVGPGGKLTYSANSPSPKLCLQSNGYYAYQAHNLATYSNTFSNAAWNMLNAAFASSGTSPDGTANAWTLTDDATNDRHITYRQVTTTAATAYTLSVFVKQGTLRYAQLRMADNNSTNAYGVIFDLQAGTAGDVNSIGSPSGSSSIASVGNGWYRCSVTFTTGGGTSSSYVVLATSNSATPGYSSGSPSYAGSSQYISVYGANLSLYPCVTDYIATTSAAVYSLPYEWNTSGVCQGVRIEEARTNLALYSNAPGNAPWANGNITNLTTTTTGPDGVSGSATLINENTSNAQHFVYQTVTKAASALAYTASVYVKQGPGRTRLAVQVDDTGANTLAYAFDVSGGQVSAASTGGTPFTSASASIVSVGNGWYRCIVSATSNTATSWRTVLFTDNGSGTSAPATNYAGTVGNGVYIYNYQLEQASTASSPIITGSAAGTRAADDISLVTSAFPYSSALGLAFAEFNAIDTPVSILMGAANFPLYANSGQASAYDGTNLTQASGSIALGSTTKMASAWGASLNVCRNAGTVASGAFDGSMAVTTLGIGIRPTVGQVSNIYARKIMILPRDATSTAELQTITT